MLQKQTLNSHSDIIFRYKITHTKGQSLATWMIKASLETQQRNRESNYNGLRLKVE